ncbi:TPA: YaiO family outer membrane beta-barrel protein, partial [Legionella pneumophila]|nr:YaiO family outer membrane beta-barrel protein [Legionella pneumophila]HEN5539453.1 YaiO family outer membrane beta-barrel protein [Legionella pneumophila]
MDRVLLWTTVQIMFFVSAFMSTKALSLTDVELHLLPSLPSYIVPLYKDKTEDSTVAPLNLSSIKESYSQKKYQQTLINGQNYLKTYPNDSDVQLFIALSYYQLKRYPEAINNFKSILNRHPNYQDALYGLIRSNIAYKQYQEAQVLIQNGLHQYPDDLVLLEFKLRIKTTMNTTQESLSISPTQESTSLNLSSIKTSYTQKKYQQTLINGQNYLKTYPNDSDVQLFVALSYYQLKRYPEAINNFKSILNRHPNYQDALYGLIRSNIAYKQYQEAQVLVQQGLRKDPGDLMLVDFKLKIKTIINQPQEFSSVQKKIKKLTSSAPQPSNLLKKKIDEVQADLPYYELTAFTINADVNKPDSIWDWSSVFLYRKSKQGAYGVGVNYANRQGTGDPQVLFNAQPKLNDSVWLDLSYAYANNPNLFPKNKVFAEGYAKLGKTVVLSVGDQYNQIENKYFNAYTGSIAKYVGNYYLSFRPTHFVPKSGPKSTLYTVKVRKYSDTEPNQYIGVILASGYSPDLYDLLSVDFIKVKNSIFWIEGLQSISKKLAFIYGSGYEIQVFPN